MDERYKLHRLYATRFAALVAAFAMAVWFNYEMIRNGIYRWDIFIILCLMAVAKVGARLYYKIVN